MKTVPEDILLSRVVDRAAGPDDWDDLEHLAGSDPKVWERLARTLRDDCFLATGVTVFNGACLERAVEVRVNGVVHVNTRLPADSMVPIGWVAVGDPGEVHPPSEHDRIWAVQRALDFPGTVWGVDRSVPTGERTKRYAQGLARHKTDRPVSEES